MGLEQSPLPDADHRFSSESRRYAGGFLPPDEINVLPQGRKTFDTEELLRLSEDIAQEGLMFPPIVVRIPQSQVMDYINPFNEIWNSNIKPDELRPREDPDGSRTYIFLVAGERRYRACRLLFDAVQNGADNAEVRRDQLLDIFGTDQEMEVRYLRNNTPENALYRQAAENTYVPLKPEEEAVHYDRMFKVFKKMDDSLTVAEFARRVVRSEQKVRTALRFCTLPEEIQNDVVEGRLQYGYAVELARLLPLHQEGAFEFFLDRVRKTRLTTEEFRELISRYIENNNSSQLEMDSIFAQAQMDTNEERIRRIVAKDIVHSTWAAIHYLNRLAVLLREGKVGKGSPFSERSPLRIHAALLSYHKELLPHMKGLLNGDYEAQERILKEGEEIVLELLAKMSPEEDDMFKL